jgi:hypothetical protein
MRDFRNLKDTTLLNIFNPFRRSFLAPPMIDITEVREMFITKERQNEFIMLHDIAIKESYTETAAQNFIIHKINYAADYVLNSIDIYNKIENVKECIRFRPYNEKSKVTDNKFIFIVKS